jgi:hypothetical protein
VDIRLLIPGSSESVPDFLSVKYGRMDDRCSQCRERKSIIQSKGWRKEHWGVISVFFQIEGVFWGEDFAHVIESLRIVKDRGSVDW